MPAALTAPEAFRFTFDAAPDRHMQAARMLGPGAGRPASDAELLPSVIVALTVKVPSIFGFAGQAARSLPRPPDAMPP
ncbi:MAG: hypothetical protein ACRDOH_30680 [Streptosporangiaceae bacterium]